LTSYYYVLLFIVLVLKCCTFLYRINKFFLDHINGPLGRRLSTTDLVDTSVKGGWSFNCFWGLVNSVMKNIYTLYAHTQKEIENLNLKFVLHEKLLDSIKNWIRHSLRFTATNKFIDYSLSLHQLLN